MIKLYPTNPGFDNRWTVEFDFPLNDMKTEVTFATWKEACEDIQMYLNANLLPA